MNTPCMTLSYQVMKLVFYVSSKFTKMLVYLLSLSDPQVSLWEVIHFKDGPPWVTKVTTPIDIDGRELLCHIFWILPAQYWCSRQCSRMPVIWMKWFNITMKVIYDDMYIWLYILILYDVCVYRMMWRHWSWYNNDTVYLTSWRQHWSLSDNYDVNQTQRQ